MEMVRRFEVYLINLDPEPGNDAKNTRPAVVVSPDELNRNLESVMIVPLSSNGPEYPSRVPTEFLNSRRLIVLDQLRTVEKLRLVKRIGEIDDATRKIVLDRLQEIFSV